MHIYHSVVHACVCHAFSRYQADKFLPVSHLALAIKSEGQICFAWPIDMKTKMLEELILSVYRLV